MDHLALKSLILAQPAGGAVRVAYAGGNDAETARLLRALTAPAAAPRPMNSAAELMGLLSPQSFAAVFDHPRFSDFRETFNGGNRAGVIEWAQAFKLRGLMTQSEADAITAYLTAPVTQDVPVMPDVTPDDVYRTRSL